MRVVAVSKVLLIGATVTVIVLLVNVSVSLGTDSTSLLRWIAAPVLGVLAGIASVVAQIRNPANDEPTAQERLLPRRESRFSPRTLARRFGRRLGKTTLGGGVALAVVIIGCAGTGAAIVGQVGMGWVTGNEHGSERLVAETSLTSEGLVITVVGVEHTPHFTRVSVRVENGTGGRISLPIAERNCLLVGGEGTVRAASPFRSDWTETLDDGQARVGEITFDGHLPADVVRARLSFAHVYAEGSDTLDSITLLGIPLRPPH